MAMSRLDISPPLPLPLHFALLPTLSPTKTLTPLLYSIINGLPVYLTLSPAHTPHVSFLPIILALFPTAPLHLIKLLPPNSTSLDLAGNAPFTDIWIPLALARGLCDKLRIGHLFSDDKPELGGTAGLLGKVMEDAISWEEESGICHNWLPSTSSIPTSSYSLHTLLNTPFNNIEIIPEDRCINTPLDKGRKAELLSHGLDSDPSKFRSGQWNKAWEAYLRWTISAWTEFQAFPSKPPSVSIGSLGEPEIGQNAASISNLLNLLPLLSSPSTNPSASSSSSHSPQLSHTLYSADIFHLLRVTLHPEPTITQLLQQLLLRFVSHLPLIGKRFRSEKEMSFMDLKYLERKARIQLCLVELVGTLLVQSFHRSTLGTHTEVPHLLGSTISKSNGLIPTPASEFREVEGVQQGEVKGTVDGGDEIKRLESRRRSSPPRSHSPNSKSSPRPETNGADVSEVIKDTLVEEAGHVVADVSRHAHRALDLSRGLMRSEDRDGWYLYMSLLASVVVALVFGMIPL